ncbi:MAG: terminase [Confluentimicrobium sp.]|uniref:phage terminase large subunit family protein n=1 Tax=Actibacterium sp. TaxID=1872125 RepID=UPI000C431BC2|nr:terminase gpA endonuclease subunit [Actibacterium sp.]MBC55479.1 terminase [Actibacterium sp.]
MSDALTATRRRAMRALTPPPRLSLPDWIEGTMRLPEGVSATPGPVRLWPYQRGIAEAVSGPLNERVTVVKPVRVGLTTLLSSTVAAFCATEPCPIMVLQPTEADCRDYVVSDLEPIFTATPELRGLLSAEADETGRNTLLSRRFPGGSLRIVPAKSPRNLRRMNIRVLLIDEADAMLPGPEGSPLTLAERRTLSFANRKIIMGSTPTLEATSNVLRAYAESDQRVYECPCPHCGEFHEIMWADIQWPEGEPLKAAYVCPSCGAVTEESGKAAMVSAGCWRITRPEVQGHAGFRLNALVSTLANASWGKIAQEFIASKDHPDKLQVWTNTLMAQGWREAAEELNEAELAARAEPFGLPDRIPADCLLVTVGVDVQRDRLELIFLGHGRDDLFVLSQSVIWGDPLTGDDVWTELDEALRTVWRHPKGGHLTVSAAAVDAGDGVMMDRVLSYTRGRLGRRIVAIKGVPGNRPAIKASEGRGSRLFVVGVDSLKGQLHNRLSRGRSIRFSDTLEARFYEELASERLVVRYRKGAPYRQWERRPGMRAESLDALIYAWAVRGLVGVDLGRREEEIASVTGPQKSPTVVKSRWINRD